MPERINKASHTQALVTEFRTTGRLPISLDETIVPVAVVADLRDAIAELEGDDDSATTNSLLAAILTAILSGQDPDAAAVRRCLAWAEADGNQNTMVLWPTDRDLYVLGIDIYSANGNDMLYWGVYDADPEPGWDVTYGSTSGHKTYLEYYAGTAGSRLLDSAPGPHANFKKGAMYPANTSFNSQAILGARQTPYNAPYHPTLRFPSPIRLASGEDQGFFVRRLNNSSFGCTIWFAEAAEATGLSPGIHTGSPWE